VKKSRGFIIKQATGMDIICLIIENTKKRRALWLIHHADLVCNRNEKREEALPKVNLIKQIIRLIAKLEAGNPELSSIRFFAPIYRNKGQVHLK